MSKIGSIDPSNYKRCKEPETILSANARQLKHLIQHQMAKLTGFSFH